MTPNRRATPKNEADLPWSNPFLMTAMVLLFTMMSSNFHTNEVKPSTPPSTQGLHTLPHSLLKSITKPPHNHIPAWKTTLDTATAALRNVGAKPPTNGGGAAGGSTRATGGGAAAGGGAGGGGSKTSAALTLGISTKGIVSIFKPEVINETIVEKLSSYLPIAIHVATFCFVGYMAYRKICSRQDVVDDDGVDEQQGVDYDGQDVNEGGI